MDQTIIVAGIMAGGTVATQLIIAAVNRKATTKIINYRVDQLEVKVMEHNKLIARVAICETKLENLGG